MERLNLRAYEFGLRLGQLEELLDDYKPSYLPPSASERAEAHVAVACLRETIVDLLTIGGQASPKLAVITAMLEEITRLWAEISTMNSEQFDSGWLETDVLYQLEELRNTFAELLDTSAIHSAELGRQLCIGSWIPRNPDDDGGNGSKWQPYPSEQVWRWDDEDRIDSLLGELGTGIYELCPVIKVTTEVARLLPYDLSKWRVWYLLEVALRSLKSFQPQNNKGGLVPDQDPDTRKKSKRPYVPRNEKVLCLIRRVAQNPQACKTDIANELASNPREVANILRAERRFAKRHRLPDR